MWQKIHCGRVEVMKQGSVLIGQRTLSLATGVGDGVGSWFKLKTRNDPGGGHLSIYSQSEDSSIMHENAVDQRTLATSTVFTAVQRFK